MLRNHRTLVEVCGPIYASNFHEGNPASNFHERNPASDFHGFSTSNDTRRADRSY